MLYSKNIFILTLTLLFSLSVCSQSNDQKKYVDSMMSKVHHTTGKQKLEALNTLALGMKPYKEGLTYAQMFEEEAVKQSDKLSLADAYLYKAEHHYWVTVQDDSALFYLDKAEKTGLREINTVNAVRMRYAIYVANQKYTLALYLIKKRFEEGRIERNSIHEAHAYIDLAHVYRKLGDFKDAVEAARKAVDILNIDKKDEHLIHKLAAFVILIRSYRADGQYELAINSSDSVSLFLGQLRVLNKELSGDYDNHDNDAVLNCLQRADIYLAMGDTDNARKSLDIVKNIYMDQLYKSLWVDYLLYESRYYYKTKNYEQALLSLNKINDVGIGIDATVRMSVNTTRSQVLHKLNRSAEAYQLLEEIVEEKDSLNSKQALVQISELQTIYEVNKMKTDMKIQSAQLERTKAIVAGLICISLLLLILIIIAGKNKKDKEKKNKIIYEQYRQMKSYLDRIRSQREELTLSRLEQKDEPVNWAERAYHYLMETEMFKVNDLSRDDLAIALGTNRQYLINAIKEETGKTFKDYINTIRIAYAYEMLVKDWTASIESIYLEAGFSTRSTFNRLFKEQYGLSPAELREVAKQKEEYLMSQAKILKKEEIKKG